MSASPHLGDFNGFDFLTGGGEMGARMRAHAWKTTPFGDPSTWPQSLRSALSICLGSSFQIAIYWGPELALLYNDAWSQIPGEKHPWALGHPAREVWPEIWDTIGPLFARVLREGEATLSRDQLLPMHRRGFTEECYFDYTFSPIRSEAGGVGGIFNIAVETTFRVLSARRTRLLKDLGELTTQARTAEDACTLAATALSSDPFDLPFCLIYLKDVERPGHVFLAGITGLERSSAVSPSTIELSDSSPVWPVAEALATSIASDVDDCQSRFGFGLPGGPWPEPCERALIIPLPQVGANDPAGAAIIGISPRLLLDTEYRAFLDRVAALLATTIANARAYEQERKRAEDLAELDRAKTAFFSNVSHEFRTPLTLMLGPIEDILAKPEDQVTFENRQLLQVVQRSGLRLQRLVNTLLDFSRIEAGRTQACYEPTDLATVTAELASSFRSAMDRAGLRFTVDCAALPQTVYVDREMWEKIVLNLLSNAFKYTLEGAVSVRVREQNGSAELSIADTGPGIPSDELPRLFERFHRVEGTRGRTHEGTGIGLALVQELVKLHGGAVTVESTPGQGSTFTVSIPFGCSHLPQDRIGAGTTLPATAVHSETYVEEALRWLPTNDTLAEPESVPVAVVGHRSRVLLADDNADMRDYVRRLLSARYEVTAVSNGEQALASAMSQLPDLVLTDVMMPRLDGFGLLKALRAHERTNVIPVLLLSARAGEEAHVEGLTAGADDYLVKPFSARELLARVEAHLSLARMRKEADRARRLSETRLGLAIEATELFAWEWEPDKDELRGSGKMAAIFGAVLTSSADSFRLLHPDDSPAHRAKVERITREGGSYHSEFRIHRADTGAIAWLEDRATALTDEQGRVRSVVGVVADVTERKARENALRASEARQAFLLTLSDAIRPLGDPETIKRAASRVLGERLRVNRAFYAEIDGDDWVVEGGYEQGVESMAPGRYAAGTYGMRIMNVCRAGQQIVFRDTRTDVGFSPEERAAHLAISIVGAVGIPLIKDGKLVAILAVHTAEPREWADDDIELIQETAERTWAAVERTRSEQALRESEGRFRTLFDALDEAVMIIERLPLRADGLRDWRYVGMNPAAQAMFRIGDLTGLSVRDNFPQEDEGWYDIYDTALESGEVARFEREAQSQGVVLQMYVARIGSRAHGRIMVVMQDVTARRRAAEALRESEERLRLATDHAEIGMWDVDEIDDLLIWPPRVKAMFGISANVSVSMQDFYNGLHPADRDATTAAYAAAKDPAQRALYDVEYRTIGKEDGRIRWVAAKGRGVFDESGRCLRVIGTAIDITERKRMERALAASEERLQQVFAQAPVAVAVLRGRQLVFELANSYYQMFLPGRELLGKPLATAMPEVSPELLGILNRVLDTGEPFVGHEYLVPLDRDRDGVAEDCWFTFVYQPWRQLDGSVIGVVVVAVDVSTHVRARQELERVNKELEEFAYVASHDLQEPLRMVNIYSHLLLKRFVSDSPEAEEYAQLVRQGVKRMETLIKDLLTYSRTVQHEDVPIGIADLPAALEEAQAILRSRIEEDGAVITTDPLPSVRGDTKQLGHVFQNLLSNALKYRSKERRPEIHIDAKRQDGQWVVAVRDNGIGFEQNHAERIFGLFKRLHTDEYPGTGLGLAICQRIVERYGGRMWAEGRPGNGATFFFTLSAAEGE